MRLFILTVLTILFLISCDCKQDVSGTVLDDKTGKPLSNIEVYNKNKISVKTKTDTAGHFKLSNISGGYGCPPMTVIIDDNRFTKLDMSTDAGAQKEIRLKEVN